MTKDELEAIRARVDKVDADFIPSAREDIASLVAEVNRIRSVLGQVEFVNLPDRYGELNPTCPWCGKVSSMIRWGEDGHTEDCPRQRALRGE